MTGNKGNPYVALVNVAAILFGTLFLVAALLMDASWQWHHFLPTWAFPWSVELRILLVLRLLVAALGLAVLVLLRPWLVRAVAAGQGRRVTISCITTAIAIIAAFAATEGILQTRSWHSVQEHWDQEPQRIRNMEYG